MSCDVLIGGQWGDEGKAKMIDFLTPNYDYIVRYQGGANAGHTVVLDDMSFIFHLVPSGLLHQGKTGCIGNGVVLETPQLMDEIGQLNSAGIEVKGRLLISDNCHILMPYHKLMDRYREEAKRGTKIGTTCRGIGPCYEDKIVRRGIRLSDLYSKSLKDKINAVVDEKNFLFTKLYKQPAIDANEMYEEALKYGENLKDYRANLSEVLNTALKQGKSVFMEGAQGTGLDIDFGTYPYVTSSNPTAGGACTGAGISPRAITNVFAVMKAYITRVGGGPFPSEQDNEIGENIRKIGNEFGATTGRPRRCGWFDFVQARHSVMINGINKLLITKLDVLDSFDNIKVCTEYDIDGQRTSSFPSNIEELEKAKPVYKDFNGWKTDTTNIKKPDDLPDNAKKYIHWLEDNLETDITMISIGPRREQTLIKG